MTAQTGAAERAQWIANLDEVAALEPAFFVAGHKKVENDNDPKIIGASQQYLRDIPESSRRGPRRLAFPPGWSRSIPIGAIFARSGIPRKQQSVAKTAEVAIAAWSGQLLLRHFRSSRLTQELMVLRLAEKPRPPLSASGVALLLPPPKRTAIQTGRRPGIVANRPRRAQRCQALIGRCLSRSLCRFLRNRTRRPLGWTARQQRSTQ